MGPGSMIPMTLNRRAGRYEADDAESEDPEMKKLAKEDKKFAVQMLREGVEDPSRGKKTTEDDEPDHDNDDGEDDGE